MSSIKWTYRAISEGILKIVKKLNNGNKMPTRAQVVDMCGNNSLAVAITKHGGYKYWANELGLEMTVCETRKGEYFECICCEYLESMGFICKTPKPRYPYDILADEVKIDVKCGSLYNGSHGNFYTFNLEKEMPTCDIYVCYCLGDKMNIIRTYVIPAVIMSGKTQLSIGEEKSKYDRYLSRWDIIREYADFLNIYQNA